MRSHVRCGGAEIGAEREGLVDRRGRARATEPTLEQRQVVADGDALAQSGGDRQAAFLEHGEDRLGGALGLADGLAGRRALGLALCVTLGLALGEEVLAPIAAGPPILGNEDA